MIWDSLIRDPQIELGKLRHNNQFRQLVEELEVELDDMLDEPLTLELLMEAQYRWVAMVARCATRDTAVVEKIASGLSQFEIADIVIEVAGETKESYFKKRPGLSDEEYALVKLGAMTVGELLESRPAVIIRPLFRSKKHQN